MGTFCFRKCVGCLYSTAPAKTPKSPAAHFAGLRSAESKISRQQAVMSTVCFPGTYGYVGQRDPPPDRSCSPWRQKYGGYANPRFSSHGTSGLKPIHPQVSRPFGLAEKIDPMAPVVEKPGSEELDDIFVTERFQLNHNIGLRSWLVAPLSSNLEHPSRLKFTIDESKWHPVLRQSHWHDYRALIYRDDPERGMWSVDNYIVWSKLRVVIEMANHMLNRVLRSRW